MPKKEQKHIYRHLKEQEAGVKSVILQDIADKLTSVTREQIETYFKAQNFKQDYVMPKGLNEKQKEQVEQIVTQTIQKQEQKATKEQSLTQEKQERAKTAKTEAPKTTKSKGRGR